MTNMKIALIRWVIEADREKAYKRHPWQNFDEMTWLFGGDMGAETTKFLTVLTHQEKFNSGSLMRLLVMFKKAADNYPNLLKVFPPSVFPLMEYINNSSLLCVRLESQRLYACAPIDSSIYVLIPTLSIYVLLQLIHLYRLGMLPVRNGSWTGLVQNGSYSNTLQPERPMQIFSSKGNTGSAKRRSR